MGHYSGRSDRDRPRLPRVLGSPRPPEREGVHIAPATARNNYHANIHHPELAERAAEGYGGVAKPVERVVSGVQQDERELYPVQLNEQGVSPDTVAVATDETLGSCHGEIEHLESVHFVSLVPLLVEWEIERAVPVLEGRSWSGDAGTGVSLLLVVAGTLNWIESS